MAVYLKGITSKGEQVKAKLFSKGDEDGFLDNISKDNRPFPYVLNNNKRQIGQFNKMYLFKDNTGNKNLLSPDEINTLLNLN